jgi:hypothetical protein
MITNARLSAPIHGADESHRHLLSAKARLTPTAPDEERPSANRGPPV